MYLGHTWLSTTRFHTDQTAFELSETLHPWTKHVWMSEKSWEPGMSECSEQLLFSCVSSKVSICNYIICRLSHVTCLCWSLGHAKQFLFSFLCSNVDVYGWKWQCLFFLPQQPQPHPCMWVKQSTMHFWVSFKWGARRWSRS